MSGAEEVEGVGLAERPARSRRFSSSSSATLRSRYVKWALRRSREFCAAMRLRWARASLRSSGDMVERGRFLGGSSDDMGRESEEGSTKDIRAASTS